MPDWRFILKNTVLTCDGYESARKAGKNIIRPRVRQAMLGSMNSLSVSPILPAHYLAPNPRVVTRSCSNSCMIYFKQMFCINAREFRGGGCRETTW